MLKVAELTIRYYEDFGVEPILEIQGKNFEKSFYNDDAKKLFIKLIGGNENELEQRLA